MILLPLCFTVTVVFVPSRAIFWSVPLEFRPYPLPVQPPANAAPTRVEVPSEELNPEHTRNPWDLELLEESTFHETFSTGTGSYKVDQTQPSFLYSTESTRESESPTKYPVLYMVPQTVDPNYNNLDNDPDLHDVDHLISSSTPQYKAEITDDPLNNFKVQGKQIHHSPKPFDHTIVQGLLKTVYSTEQPRRGTVNSITTPTHGGDTRETVLTTVSINSYVVNGTPDSKPKDFSHGADSGSYEVTRGIDSGIYHTGEPGQPREGHGVTSGPYYGAQTSHSGLHLTSLASDTVKIEPQLTGHTTNPVGLRVDHTDEPRESHFGQESSRQSTDQTVEPRGRSTDHTLEPRKQNTGLTVTIREQNTGLTVALGEQNTGLTHEPGDHSNDYRDMVGERHTEHTGEPKEHRSGQMYVPGIGGIGHTDKSGERRTDQTDESRKSLTGQAYMPIERGEPGKRRIGDTGEPGKRRIGQTGEPGKSRIGHTDEPGKRRIGDTYEPGKRRIGQTGEPGKRRIGQTDEPGKRRIGDTDEPGKRRIGHTDEQGKRRIGHTDEQGKRRIGQTGEPGKRRIGQTDEPEKRRIGQTDEPGKHHIGQTGEPGKRRIGQTDEPGKRRIGQTGEPGKRRIGLTGETEEVPNSHSDKSTENSTGRTDGPEKHRVGHYESGKFRDTRTEEIRIDQSREPVHPRFGHTVGQGQRRFGPARGSGQRRVSHTRESGRRHIGQNGQTWRPDGKNPVDYDIYQPRSTGHMDVSNSSVDARDSFRERGNRMGNRHKSHTAQTANETDVSRSGNINTGQPTERSHKTAYPLHHGHLNQREISHNSRQESRIHIDARYSSDTVNPQSRGYLHEREQPHRSSSMHTDYPHYRGNSRSEDRGYRKDTRNVRSSERRHSSDFSSIPEMFAHANHDGIIQPPYHTNSHFNTFHAGYPYNSIQQNTNSETCSCECNSIQTDPACKWQMIFKAVAGNGRTVLADYMNDSYINGYEDEAVDIGSDLPYKHPEILKTWNQLFISQVKLEVLKDGLVKAWFLFKSTGTNRQNWMTQERLIASSYDNIKSQTFDFFDLENDQSRGTFIVLPESTNCEDTCGYLELIDSGSSGCPWSSYTTQPYFLYSMASDQCGVWGEEGLYGIGDRLVISAKVCDLHL